MRVMMYRLVPRLPDGKGKRTAFAEQYWSGKPLNKICGRRYLELVSSDEDIFDFPPETALVDIVKWSQTTDYAAIFVNGKLVPVIGRDMPEAHKRELVRILSLYARGNKNWVKPCPEESL